MPCRLSIEAALRPDGVEICHAWHVVGWRGRSRRIAEDAGLAREMFGQVKMATVLEYPAPRLPLNPALRSLFFSFLVDNGLMT